MKGEPVAVELMVQFNPDVPVEERRQKVERLGCVWREEIAPQRIAVVRIPAGSDIREWLFLLRCTEGVAHVEVNGEVQPTRGDR